MTAISGVEACVPGSQQEFEAILAVERTLDETDLHDTHRFSGRDAVVAVRKTPAGFRVARRALPPLVFADAFETARYVINVTTSPMLEPA